MLTLYTRYSQQTSSMKHHFTDTHEHHSEIHNIALFSQSTSLRDSWYEETKEVETPYRAGTGLRRADGWGGGARDNLPPCSDEVNQVNPQSQ